MSKEKAMLQLQGIGYRIADRQLLTDVDMVIQPSRRVALIGPNGAGKTTLLRLMIGQLKPSQGQVARPKNYRIGYLPQEELTLESGTILQTALEGRQDLLALEKKISDLHLALDSSSEDQDRLLEQLGEFEQQFSAADGYKLETKAKAFLSGLGFQDRDFNKPLSTFSGGWRMRAYLAQLLLGHPDLLLLDEPTNHLDLPALEWLEQYLLGFDGSIVLVSHDRYFIDRLAHEIYEISLGKIEHYAGNYGFYEKKKEHNEQLIQKKWEEQQAEINRQERFIERFRYKATKAAQVQSRIKALEKMERIERLPERRRFGFKLDPGVRSFKDVLQMEHMCFRYDADWVLKDLNLHICRGERLALVGINGAGKTTLARIIARQLSPQEGSVNYGNRTHIGYYAQHQVAALDLDATVYDEVASTVADSYIPKIRDALGIFQFSGDDVFKKIKVLSGGEKARVSLSKMLLSPVNFLVMDEPTNHLDMVSREALEDALVQYEGTMLLISHDRYFLDKLVHRVIELKEKQLVEYAGNYSYYLEKREMMYETPDFDQEAPEKIITGKKTKLQKRLEAEARQRISKERNHLETNIQWLEQEIDLLEKRKSEIEQSLSRSETYQDKGFFLSLQKELADIQKQLKQYYAEWEEDRLALDDLLSQLTDKLDET